ncbi:universal stress protein [Candidatus Borrarchaeum sp.]|uniref:universal stress protein n=1 Tax=Candidatus Borrarchaeum sp. TaxID=2846742 RepID=UPI00257EF6E8|nr:universal stress protein [Candidatus Borrarchaeum sp.]
MYTKILVPIDGSKIALKAAGHAINMAKQMNAELVILYVAPETEDTRTRKQLFGDAALEEEIAKFSELFGKSYIKEVERICSTKDVKMHTMIIRGKPGPKIIEEAKKEDIDLIVMGRKSEMTETMQLGPAARYVAEHSKCPVLIITLSAPDFC